LRFRFLLGACLSTLGPRALGLFLGACLSTLGPWALGLFIRRVP